MARISKAKQEELKAEERRMKMEDLHHRLMRAEAKMRKNTQYQNFRKKKSVKGRDFSGQDLTGSNFREVDVEGCNFDDAILHFCNFKDAKNLDKASFKNAKTSMSVGLENVEGDDDITPPPTNEEAEEIRFELDQLHREEMMYRNGLK